MLCNTTNCFDEAYPMESYCPNCLNKRYKRANMPSGEVRDEIKAKVMAKQIGGEHYKKNSIQPWDIIDEYELDFYEGNALKYLLRDKSVTDAGKRKEDLEKAIHYIEKKLTEWNENPRQSHIDYECDGMHGKSIKAEDIK